MNFNDSISIAEKNNRIAEFARFERLLEQLRKYNPALESAFRDKGARPHPQDSAETIEKVNDQVAKYLALEIELDLFCKGSPEIAPFVYREIHDAIKKKGESARVLDLKEMSEILRNFNAINVFLGNICKNNAALAARIREEILGDKTTTLNGKVTQINTYRHAEDVRRYYAKMMERMPKEAQSLAEKYDIEKIIDEPLQHVEYVRDLFNKLSNMKELW